MDDQLKKKLEILKSALKGFGSALVAFSGGVDSSLLLKVASDVLPNGAVAVTVRSVLSPPGEVEAAQKIARNLGVEHLIFEFEPLFLDEIRTNSPERCYHCKKALARLLKVKAEEHG